MKKSFLLLFIFLIGTIISCSKKDIQLPLIKEDGLSQIYNHSSIWLFFEKNGKDTLAVENKNNKIINTHWILHIDRRLTMEKVVPFLIEMQALKIKPSMHKKEGTFLYHSYANTKSNNISLIELKPTNFQFRDKQIFDSIHKNSNIKILLQKNKVFINKTQTNLDQLKYLLLDYKKKDTLHSVKLFLNYNENISYQEYLQTKMLLSKINMAIDSTEYIYSLK